MPKDRPWTRSMPEEQFQRMREILAAPSPVGFEAAMTRGVILPMIESFKPDGWAIDSFRGTAGLVVDTHPGRDDLLSVMLIGHADKIRMQVRSIGEDGKIWINSDSFMPGVVVGHEVLLFSEDPERPGQHRVLEGGTIEAVGAIHFASTEQRSGAVGIKKTQLYLELQLHGDERKKQVEALGIRPGDALILRRPIARAFAPDTFHGAYLDNGLGCFVVEELARLLAKREAPLEHVRVLLAIATHEEIGRIGSRALAYHYEPDVLIAVDVNHDYDAAPNISEQRMPPLRMGSGFTFDIGAATSAVVNSRIEAAAKSREIPFMRDVVGRDTGTDGMAAAFIGVDAASASVGFPIRNMHTISETGHTGDVLAALHALEGFIEDLEADAWSADDLRRSHPRLDQAEPLRFKAVVADEDEDG